MNGTGRSRRRTARWLITAGVLVVSAGLVGAALIEMTLEDFHLSGTQVGVIGPNVIETSNNCVTCHGYFEPATEPYSTWKGSLMGVAGYDPMFYAQLANANQDVGNVGYYCLRCHVPMSFVTGHANQPLGNTLDDTDRDGVTCHFCHAMVDPIYKPGISPIEDLAILNAMPEVPRHYANSMFVLDPTGTRRGTRDGAVAPHTRITSPFHRTGDFCGTCHDVGNVAVSRQPDGSYRYNKIDQRVPDEDPHAQFPLERTYTEWKLSEFASTGVNMQGRFGGPGVTVVSTCQDCHMPRATGRSCFFGPSYDDLATHEFAGAAAWVLEITELYYQGNPNIEPQALQAGRAKAISMLRRSASIELAQECGALRVRVINESGHKLPTGHIEGRRVWVNVRFYDASNMLVGEYGHYDFGTAELDEPSTTIYEMHVGLSDFASQLTGLPAGATSHMALADTIVKDSRIPPRGFNNAAYEAAGAPTVAHTYADGQYWDDAYFAIPPDAVRAEATVNYQNMTKHYMEVLRHGNVTNHWGETLHDLWLATNKAPPIEMTTDSSTVSTGSFVRGDMNCDAVVNIDDVALFIDVVLGRDGDRRRIAAGDLNHDGRCNGDDMQEFVTLVIGG